MTYMVKAYGKEMFFFFFDKFDILYIKVQEKIELCIIGAFDK